MNIAVLDDDSIFLGLVENLLPDQTVYSFTSYHELLTSIGDIPRPDLIIMDIHLGGFIGQTGDAVIAELRSKNVIGNIPVIFVSVDNRPEVVDKCKSIPNASYLFKGEIQKLPEIIKTHISNVK